MNPLWPSLARDTNNPDWILSLPPTLAGRAFAGGVTFLTRIASSTCFRPSVDKNNLWQSEAGWDQLTSLFGKLPDKELS